MAAVITINLELYSQQRLPTLHLSWALACISTRQISVWREVEVNYGHTFSVSLWLCTSWRGWRQVLGSVFMFSDCLLRLTQQQIHHVLHVGSWLLLQLRIRSHVIKPTISITSLLIICTQRTSHVLCPAGIVSRYPSNRPSWCVSRASIRHVRHTSHHVMHTSQQPSCTAHDMSSTPHNM